MSAPLFINWVTGQAVPIGITNGTNGYLLQSDGTGNATWTGFLQLGSGAVARTWNAKESERITPYDFGAVGDGNADDTTPVQNAINRAIAAGAPLFVNGTFKITSTLTINNSIFIQGSGQSLAAFKPAQNVTCFTITSNNPVVFSDFAINGTNNNASGAAILVQPSSGENQNSKFSRLFIQQCWNGIDFEKASTWTLHDCIMFGMQAQFVIVRNTNNADSGDSSISDCTFSTSGAPSANQIGVYQESSGGLKITNCKFNNCSMGYELNCASGIASQDLLISNCSIEGYTLAGILLTTQAAAAGQWRNVMVTGCQFAVPGASSIVAIQISGATVNTWLLDVTITDNTINLNNSNQVGIKCDFVTGVVIGHNMIENINASTGVVGISFTSNVALGMIAHNNFRMNGAGSTIFCASTGTIIDDPFGMSFTILGANITGAQNGSRIFVSDGAPASHPLTGSSTGTTAFRQNGAWYGI